MRIDPENGQPVRLQCLCFRMNDDGPARGHAYIQAVAGLLLNHTGQSVGPGGRRFRDKPQTELGSEKTSQPARQDEA